MTDIIRWDHVLTEVEAEAAASDPVAMLERQERQQRYLHMIDRDSLGTPPVHMEMYEDCVHLDCANTRALTLRCQHIGRSIWEPDEICGKLRVDQIHAGSHQFVPPSPSVAFDDEVTPASEFAALAAEVAKARAKYPGNENRMLALLGETNEALHAYSVGDVEKTQQEALQAAATAWRLYTEGDAALDSADMDRVTIVLVQEALHSFEARPLGASSDGPFTGCLSCGKEALLEGRRWSPRHTDTCLVGLALAALEGDRWETQVEVSDHHAQVRFAGILGHDGMQGTCACGWVAEAIRSDSQLAWADAYSHVRGR